MATLKEKRGLQSSLFILYCATEDYVTSPFSLSLQQSGKLTKVE